jgi:hypothetical protein
MLLCSANDLQVALTSISLAKPCRLNGLSLLAISWCLSGNARSSKQTPCCLQTNDLHCSHTAVNGDCLSNMKEASHTHTARQAECAKLLPDGGSKPCHNTTYSSNCAVDSDCSETSAYCLLCLTSARRRRYTWKATWLYTTVHNNCINTPW